MTKYADKRPRPNCRVPECHQPAVALLIRHGVLGWYCSDHQNK